MKDEKLGRFRYLWLPDEHAAVVVQATKQDVAMQEWRKKRDAGVIQ